jgi:DNA-binding NarL/FixJ family response regulator
MIVEAELLGRAPELRVIGDLVARTAEGGGALLVHGDAGIGKSSLLERAVEQAQAAGFRVLRTTGVRTEANLPFAGLHQLLRPVIGGLDALPAPQRHALAGAFGLVEATADDPFLIALATLTLLADAAAKEPTVVVADDAQWLDRPSANALAFVARRLGSDPVTMLVGLRDGEPSPLEAAGIEELALQPLSEEDARDLVTSRAPVLQPSVRDRIVREAAGNPLALAELSSVVGDDAGSSGGPADALPLTARLERTFAVRADDLPPETQWLVLVAALDDRDGVAEILAAADVPPSALDPAVDARLLEVDGTSVRFRHPLIRSAIQQRASLHDRRRAHLALAGVVEDFDRAAWHHAAATDVPDEQVAALLDAAADRAMRRGAFDVALAALQRAASLSGEGRSRGTRLLRAAEVANDIGKIDAVASTLTEAEPIDVPALEDRRQAWITALALTGPRSQREEAESRSVVSAARRAGEDGQADLGLTLLQFASARSWWLDPGYAIRSEIAAAARELGPPSDARVAFISAIAPEDHLDELLARLAEGASSAQQVSGIDARRYATAGLQLGALDCAFDYYTASIAGLRREGRLGLLVRALIIRALTSVHLGTLSTVGSDLDEGLRLGVETGQPFYLATANATQAIYMAYRGEVDGAEARIAEVERFALGMQANAVLAETSLARGIIDLATGRHAEAYEQLRHHFDSSHPSFHATVSLWAITDFADAAALTGHVAEASRLLDGVEADAIRMRMPWFRNGMAYARAVLAANQDPASAEDAFAAARAMDLERWPLARSRLSLAYGTWLRRQRRVAESREALRAARDALDAMGVRYLADRAQHELGASGDAGRHRGLAALDELTPQELQIAQLAADGLSNREIGSRLYLSHRTVGSHLYRAFPKLGITSRSQLRGALR